MHLIKTISLPIISYAFYTLMTCQICSALNTMDVKVLNVGEELWNETLPLRSGSRLYQLQGLKPYTWYEVKISYPASIPAAFSLELKRDSFDMGLKMNRRLLNTEKIILKTESVNQTNQDGIYVLVTVEPEGFVAIPNAREQEFVFYNIVCDELLLGIPHKAWLVGILAMLCLGVSFIVPSFLPPHLLQKSEERSTASKDA